MTSKKIAWLTWTRLGVASHTGFPSGRLTSSNEGTWVLVHHDSSAAPQTVQSASPGCGTKNFVSARLYSAPQLHRTIVAILRICAAPDPFSSPELCHNQIDHYQNLKGRSPGNCITLDCLVRTTGCECHHSILCNDGGLQLSLIERDTDPTRLSPDNVTMVIAVLCVDDQVE